MCYAFNVGRVGTKDALHRPNGNGFGSPASSSGAGIVGRAARCSEKADTLIICAGACAAARGLLKQRILAREKCNGQTKGEGEWTGGRI